MQGVVTLKSRREFLRVRGGRRFSSDAFLLEGKLRGDTSRSSGKEDPAAPVAFHAGPPGYDGPRFGFTITKKIGNAVTRNRIRRRLKSAIAEILPLTDDMGTRCDYVVVARKAAEQKPYSDLVEDVKRAVLQVNRALRQRDGARK
ncbi:MAG: ribonuclease P protein component [Pseudomonadota bacterium]